MIWSRFTRMVTRLSLHLLALVVLTACPPPTKQVSRKKPAEIDLPAKGQPMAIRAIDSALKRFDWGPAHAAVCDGCVTPGEVTIRVVGLTKDIKVDNGPAKKRIVALIENSHNEAVDHTPSGTTFKPNMRYLMWVHSKAGKAVWGFIELGPEYDPNPNAIGLLHVCRSHKPNPPDDDANFQDCGDPYPTTASAGWIKQAHAATSAAAAVRKPGWITCDPDCCTGTTVQPPAL